MTIRTIYLHTPRFPASDQHPDAERHQVGPYVVDAIGGAPTLEEVEAVLNPPAPTAQDKLAAAGLTIEELRELLAQN